MVIFLQIVNEKSQLMFLYLLSGLSFSFEVQKRKAFHLTAN